MAFSEDMERLQTIIDSFERDNLNMEDALSRFEEGVKLIRDCRAYLEETKRRVTILMDDQEVESGFEL
ncbi:exodeoxyribonuclease VII small subunit [Synergistaceae bacterium OttesenSCG-928-I11]|nr:exodeoxyribonuclease VII small subunit [Synergistaceae bacterium OttesenSCG-928-I11]